MHLYIYNVHETKPKQGHVCEQRRMQLCACGKTVLVCSNTLNNALFLYAAIRCFVCDSTGGCANRESVSSVRCLHLQSSSTCVLRGRVFLVRVQGVSMSKPVTVFALATGVRVRTTAKSLGQGSKGDLIMLESLENRQRFSARITGFQRAEVFASGVRVSDVEWPEHGERRGVGSEERVVKNK